MLPVIVRLVCLDKWGRGQGGSGSDSDDAASDPAVAETGCCSAGAVQPDADGVPVAGAAQPDSESDYENIAESTIALDPLHDVAPVRMMQALQGTIEAVTKHAAKIARNERKAQVADKDGVLRPVTDEGGRHAFKSMVLDVQQVARSLEESGSTELEKAHAGADARRSVCPEALAIPTQKPMDSFDARTWPAAFVEWWFGDGAPNLDRQRPMIEGVLATPCSLAHQISTTRQILQTPTAR